MANLNPLIVPCPSCFAPVGETCRLAIAFEDDSTTVSAPLDPHPERRLKAAKRAEGVLAWLLTK